jgi:hypothetical protein
LADNPFEPWKVVLLGMQALGLGAEEIDGKGNGHVDWADDDAYLIGISLPVAISCQAA